MRRKTLQKVILVFMAWALLLAPVKLLAVDNGPSSWAVNSVKEARYAGILPSFLASRYTDPITRGEFTALALAYLEKAGLKAPEGSHTFLDIEGHPYESQIAKAYDAGIVQGYPNGNFGPDDLITRQEIAVLIQNLVNAVHPAQSVTPKNSYAFKDLNRISSWALSSINYCYEKGILHGTAPSTISPLANAGRQEAIVMVYNLAVNNGLAAKLSDEALGRMPVKIKENLVSGEEFLVAFEKSFGQKGLDLLNNLKMFIDFDSLEIGEKELALREGDTRILLENSDRGLEIAVATKDVLTDLPREALNYFTTLTDYNASFQLIFDNELKKHRQDESSLNFMQLVDEKFYITGYEFIDSNGVGKDFIRILQVH